MSYYFFDSCAIIRQYIDTETGHNKVNEIFNDDSNQIIICELAHLEFVSALKRKLNQGEITDSVFSNCRIYYSRDFRDNIMSGKVVLLTVDSQVFVDAQTLIVEHGLKSLDAIHLQTIIPFKELDPIFVTSDNKLAIAAANYFTVCNLNNY